MRLILFLLLLVILGPRPVFSQLPGACNGTASAIACEVTCISCNFNGFTGSTAGYPSGIAPEFCGTLENVQWLGFIAGAAEATFTITPVNCVNGDGVQVALYERCDGVPLACDKGEMGGGALPVSIQTPLLPGANYFLLIDGYAGDECEFSVSVFPPEAVFEPPLEVVQILTGPAAMCPNTTANFQVQPVSGAAAYIWTGPPGTLFDSMPSPATILGQAGLEVAVTIGNIGGQICVQAANTCEVNPPCSASINVSILPDSARPQLSGDTLASLTCTGDPLTLQVDSDPVSNVLFQWTLADSVGSISGDPNLLRLRVDSVGVYRLLATDQTNGCSSTFTVRVSEPELPTGGRIRTKDVTCYDYNNGWIGIDSIQNGTPPYLYSIEDAPFSMVNQYINLKAGDYYLVVQDAAGCEWDTTLQLQQPPELLVVLESDTTLLLGESLILWDSFRVNYPERVTSWQLQIPDMGDTLRCGGCPVMPLRSFRYVLEVQDSNGCRASDERQVAIETARQVYFPNVFAPAPDEAINDRFGPLCGSDVRQIRRFQVFNRWGQVVHERDDAAPNDVNSFWDGNVERRPGLPGVYVYSAEIVFKDGAVVKYQGDITLLR